MPSSTDVVVIGAGVIGCAVAYELAHRGASVRLLDPRAPGQGATQASAGMLAPYIEAAEHDPLLDVTVRSLALYDDFVARAAEASGIPIPYRRTGTLQVTFDEKRLVMLHRRAAELSAHGVDVRLLDAQAAHAAEPHLSPKAVGALLVPTHGFVAAADFTRSLAAAATRLGAQVLGGCRVHAIGRRGAALAVDTDGGSIAAHAVIMAAGSWSGQIAVEGSALRVPVRPVRGQLLRLGWNGPPLRRVTWGDGCYLVPWDDGTLLVGATVEEVGFNECTTAIGVHDLLEAVADVLPQAWTARFLDARAGLRPGSADGLPIVGPSRVLPGLVYATGHYRNGVLLAPLTAHLVATAVLGGAVDPIAHALRPERLGDL